MCNLNWEENDMETKFFWKGRFVQFDKIRSHEFIKAKQNTINTKKTASRNILVKMKRSKDNETILRVTGEIRYISCSETTKFDLSAEIWKVRRYWYVFLMYWKTQHGNLGFYTEGQ